MPGRPAHFNYVRLIGRLENIHKAQRHPLAYLLHVDIDGDPCKIVVWPRMPVSIELVAGDLVEVNGCLKFDISGGRKALHYIDGRIELVRRGKSPIGGGGNGVGGGG